MIGNAIEQVMFSAGQLFLLPVLLAVCVLFGHAFFALGAVVRQALQRRRGDASGFELLAAHRAEPQLTPTALEALAVERLEFLRLSARVAPMLGLVATMIPMGAALEALGEGSLPAVSRSLAVAFSAVILALIAAAVSYCVGNLRRRWYARDLATIERNLDAAETRP